MYSIISSFAHDATFIVGRERFTSVVLRIDSGQTKSCYLLSLTLDMETGHRQIKKIVFRLVLRAVLKFRIVFIVFSKGFELVCALPSTPTL